MSLECGKHQKCAKSKRIIDKVAVVSPIPQIYILQYYMMVQLGSTSFNSASFLVWTSSISRENVDWMRLFSVSPNLSKLSLISVSRSPKNSEASCILLPRKALFFTPMISFRRPTARFEAGRSPLCSLTNIWAKTSKISQP